MMFSKNVMFTYGAQIVTVLSTFLCSIMAARMLGQEGQGELSLYNNFTAIAVLLFGFSLPSGITYFISSAKIKAQSVLSIAISFLSIGMILFLISLLIIHFFNLDKVVLPSIFHGELKWYLIISFHLILLLIQAILSSIFQAEKEFKVVSIINIVGALFLLFSYSVRYFELIKTNENIFIWLIASLICSFLVQILAYCWNLFKLNKAYFTLKNEGFTYLKPIFLFSTLLFIANIVQFLNYKMDVWFINYYFNDRKMIGIYSLGVMLTQMLWLLPSALQQVLYVDISAEATRVNAYRNAQQQIKWISLYAIIGGVIGYVISPILVPLLFGNEFVASVSIIKILVVGIALFCLSMPLSAYFAGTNQVRVNLIGSFLGLIISIAGAIIFIPRYGIEGAAWVSVASYLITTLYFILVFQYEKQHLNDNLTKIN